MTESNAQSDGMTTQSVVDVVERETVNRENIAETRQLWLDLIAEVGRRYGPPPAFPQPADVTKHSQGMIARGLAACLKEAAAEIIALRSQLADMTEMYEDEQAELKGTIDHLMTAQAELATERSRVAEAERVGIEHRKAFVTLAKVLATAAPDDFLALMLANKLCRDLGVGEEVSRALSASTEPPEWVEKVREALEEYACAGLGKCEMYGTSGRCMNDMCGQSCGDSALKALALLPPVGTGEVGNG